MPKVPQSTCPTCGGKGLVRPSAELQVTLNLFRRGVWLTVWEVFQHQASDISQTGTNNRLERLRELGFLRREKAKFRRTFKYTLA